MNYSFQKLTRELYESLCHNFNSGNDVVDNFINTTECLDIGIGVTYIALDDENLMMAYYNVSTGCVVDTSNNSPRREQEIHHLYRWWDELR